MFTGSLGEFVMLRMMSRTSTLIGYLDLVLLKSIYLSILSFTSKTKRNLMRVMGLRLF